MTTTLIQPAGPSGGGDTFDPPSPTDGFLVDYNPDTFLTVLGDGFDFSGCAAGVTVDSDGDPNVIQNWGMDTYALDHPEAEVLTAADVTMHVRYTHDTDNTLDGRDATLNFPDDDGTNHYYHLPTTGPGVAEDLDFPLDDAEAFRILTQLRQASLSLFDDVTGSPIYATHGWRAVKLFTLTFEGTFAFAERVFPVAAAFGIPPRRIYPRDDGLMTSSHKRLWPPPSSIQASNRPTGYL